MSNYTQLNIPTEKETSPAIAKEKKHYRLGENGWEMETDEGWKSTDDFLTSDNSIRKDVSGDKSEISGSDANQIYGLVKANQKELPPHVKSLMEDTPEYDAYKKALSAVMGNASEKNILTLEISEKKLCYKLKIQEAIKEAERLRDFYQEQSDQAQAEGRPHQHFDHALLRARSAMSAAQQALDIFDQIQQEPNVERKNILQKILKASLQLSDYALQSSQAQAERRPDYHFGSLCDRAGFAVGAAQQALDIFDQAEQENSPDRKDILQKILKASLQEYDCALQVVQAQAERRLDQHFHDAMFRARCAMSAVQQALDIFDQAEQENSPERKDILQKKIKASLQQYYALQSSQARAEGRPHEHCGDALSLAQSAAYTAERVLNTFDQVKGEPDIHRKNILQKILKMQLQRYDYALQGSQAQAEGRPSYPFWLANNTAYDAWHAAQKALDIFDQAEAENNPEQKKILQQQVATALQESEIKLMEAAQCAAQSIQETSSMISSSEAKYP